jgi:hypothetical protein
MTDVKYRIWLLRETIAITLTLIALRLHLITITCDERYELVQRRNRVREQIAQIKEES